MPDQVLVTGSARAVLELVKKWLAEPGDHDTRIWPALRQAVEASRLADRKRFSEDCQDA